WLFVISNPSLIVIPLTVNLILSLGFIAYTFHLSSRICVDCVYSPQSRIYVRSWGAISLQSGYSELE
ncbi:TPA: hypothetical protein ACISYL_004005, partial [Salmonella enterica subsp. enterica serovar Chailey]